MRWFQVESFFEAWRPVYLISKAVCLVTVTGNFIDKTAERTTTDHTIFVLGLLMCGLYLYNLCGIYLQRGLPVIDSKLITGGLFAHLALFVFTVISALIINYINGFRIAEFFTIVRKSDQQMAHQFGYQWNYQKEHFRILIYLVIRYAELVFFLFVMSLFSKGIDNLKWSEIISIVLSFSWIMVFFQTLGLYMILVLGTIRNRFFRLNEQMKIYFETRFTERDMMADSRKRIRRFALMHALLSDSVKLFNYCYGKQAMFVLGCSFGYTVFAIFGIIHSNAVSVDAETIRLARINILFNGFYLSFLFQMVICCHRLHYECHRSSTIVHYAASCAVYEKNAFKELLMFSQQLKHHSPKVSCGLFDLDWALCSTMVGSLCTYLIILLQFDLVNVKWN